MECLTGVPGSVGGGDGQLVLRLHLEVEGHLRGAPAEEEGALVGADVQPQLAATRLHGDECARRQRRAMPRTAR